MFRWTPLGSDVGDHQFRFSATVDGVAASQLVPVRVVAGDSPISFRSPVGEGTTLDLGRAPCAVVPLLVDDTSATEVDIEPGDALPAGATLTRDGPLSGQLSSARAQALAQEQTIFPFSLVATDDGGARAEKRYTIVLGILAPRCRRRRRPEPRPNRRSGSAAADVRSGGADHRHDAARRPHHRRQPAHLRRRSPTRTASTTPCVFWSTDAPARSGEPGPARR